MDATLLVFLEPLSRDKIVFMFIAEKYNEITNLTKLLSCNYSKGAYMQREPKSKNCIKEEDLIFNI